MITISMESSERTFGPSLSRTARYLRAVMGKIPAILLVAFLGLAVASAGWRGVITGQGLGDHGPRSMTPGSAEALIVAWAFALAGSFGIVFVSFFIAWNLLFTESNRVDGTGALVSRGLGFWRVNKMIAWEEVEAISGESSTGGPVSHFGFWDITYVPRKGGRLCIETPDLLIALGICQSREEIEAVAEWLRHKAVAAPVVSEDYSPPKGSH